MIGFEPADPRRADAEEIKRAAERAAELTRQMLAFSRKQVLQPKVVDLNIALQKVEPMLRRVIGEDIVMTIAPKATRPRARVDPGQIEQVIMNLVVNARDAMPKGGRLTVETGDAHASMRPCSGPTRARRLRDARRVGHRHRHVGRSARAHLRAVLHDQGQSARAPASASRPCTASFSRATDTSTSTASPGWGPRSGSICRARMAMPPARRSAGRRRSPAAPSTFCSSKTIRPCDDRRARRCIRIGYSVTEAASGRAGLALGSDDTRHFDLALCDVILGDMSGPAVYEALRALRPSVRVLYMSGYADEAIVRTGVLERGTAVSAEAVHAAGSGDQDP